MSRQAKIKTIDVNVKEWFDTTNGNSYFAGVVTINYAMKSERLYDLNFQYGYGDHYKDMTLKLLKQVEEIPIDPVTPLWKYCQDNNIILRTFKQENCRKRDLV
jgi:hypothetical protein